LCVLLMMDEGIIQNSSACFGWYPHPSSVAHANCNYNIWHWSNRICYCPLLWSNRNTWYNAPTKLPDVVITVCVCSWWLMRASSKTCRADNKTVYSLHVLLMMDEGIIQNSSACFGWYPHPSSVAHANCNYNIWHWSNRICYRPLLWSSRNAWYNAPTKLPDVVITVCVCSWWWMRVSSKTCRAVLQTHNKTVYRSILLDNYWHWITMQGPMNIKFKMCTMALMPEKVTTFLFSHTHIISVLEDEAHNNELWSTWPSVII